MRTFWFFLFFLLASSALAQDKSGDTLYARFETNRGVMEFELYKEIAPVTVASFVNLATRGYYDGLSFHRVEDNFVIQGGDPAGNGSGGPGYDFEDELFRRHNSAGILSMANAGPGTNGSQFFITHQAVQALNGLHTVFGRIISGMEIVFEIRRDDQIISISIEGPAREFLETKRNRVIEWNQILDAGFPDLKPALIN